MMPRSVHIQYGQCHMKLCLPGFFINASLNSIRKVMKMLRECPWQNKEAIEALDRFFSKWEPTCESCLEHAVSPKRNCGKAKTEMEKRAWRAAERYSKVLSAYKEIEATDGLERAKGA